MKVSKLSDFSNGWFIGDFEPTLLKTSQFEVAHHKYIKGYKGIPHTHKVSTEYNYVISGKLIASGEEVNSGEIFTYFPNEVSDVTFLEDTDLIIIKSPSIPNDKFNC